MKTHLPLAGLALLLTAAPCLAGAQPPRLAGPYRIDRQPGESLAAAIQRSMRTQRLLGLHGRAPGQGAEVTPINAPPSISSGKILTSTINVQKAPATPKIQINYSSPGYLLGAYFEFVSPSGYQTFTTSYYSPFPATTGGTVTIEDGFGYSPLSLYSAAGSWIMTAAVIEDYDGQQTQYARDQLPSLFPSVNLTVINNGTPDTTPPTVTAGKLLTPTVQLSSAYPVFKAQLTVTDNLSGMHSDGDSGLALLTPDGTEYYYAYANVPAPVRSGTITNGIDFAEYANIPTGTWTIAYYNVCDVVHNCYTDSSPNDIQALFGTTTFTVVP